MKAAEQLGCAANPALSHRQRTIPLLIGCADTMQKLALIASPLRRQYDPTAEATTWRLLEVDLIGVD